MTLNIDGDFFNEVATYRDKSLRDYQEDSKQKIYNLWKETDTVLLQMPTGTGKTKLFVSIINDLAHYCETHFENKKEHIKILILAHRKELIEQITNEIRNVFHLNCSKIDATENIAPELSEPICVASIQTLNRRIEKWRKHPFNFIIVDEAHHIKGKSYRRILNTFDKAKILGVTATPYRMNEEGLRQEFKELIVSPSIKEFIDAGWLSNYEYYSIKKSNEFYKHLSDVPLDSYGDYSPIPLWNYCKPDKIQAEIVATYLQYAKGKKGIVYTINKQHNSLLCKEFRRCGISAYGIDCDTPPEERATIINKFRHGQISILCNVDIFTEGFDCPDVEFVQLARPTKSLGLYLQQVGRGLRKSEFKEKVIFLDNVGLYNRFGLPSAKRQWAHHYVGKSANEYGKEYAEDKDREPSFSLKKRLSDLSEGNEEIHLIETTGLNEIKKEQEIEFVSSFYDTLNRIVESIFENNLNAYHKYIEGYTQENCLTFSSDIIEDILNPCPNIKAKVTDMDKMRSRLENDFKPIIRNNEIDYVEYKNLDDLISFATNKVKTIFKKKLAESQVYNFVLLDKFTANQLLVFFEKRYGEKHNMTKKFKKYCDLFDSNETWESVKNVYFMRKHIKKTHISKYVYDNITIERSYDEYYE